MYIIKLNKLVNENWIEEYNGDDSIHAHASISI